MHTPSGRFQPSTRLCLSISDFHPKSFNPAWEVSTILIGLMSFMTSDEMTTGSISATSEGRKWAAARSRWWNSTGGGSQNSRESNSNSRGVGAVKAGDGGAKFRSEWPELHEENVKWMKEHCVDMVTGHVTPTPGSIRSTCSPETAALRRRPGGSVNGVGAVVEGGQVAREVGRSWWRRYKVLLGAVAVFGYVLIARLFGDDGKS